MGGTNQVDFIDDYCPAKVFTGMIKSDDNVNYDNVGEFNSFQFNVFKFPDVDTGKILHHFNSDHPDVWASRG